MSGKASRISELWEGIDPRGWDVRFAAYFHHFNREDYYEAHDVLESLWLEGGRKARGAAFYQGLIQLAGPLFICESIMSIPITRCTGSVLRPLFGF